VEEEDGGLLKKEMGEPDKQSHVRGWINDSPPPLAVVVPDNVQINTSNASHC
jgi:hypothetical protein